MKLYNRIDERGRFLGPTYRMDEYGPQEDTHGYSVLQANKCAYGDKAFEALELLCLAQECCWDEGMSIVLRTMEDRR